MSYTINGISQDDVNVIFINGVQVYCYNDNEVSNVSFTPCQHTKATNNELSERVDVEFTGKGVNITHYLLNVNCAFDTVLITQNFENGVLNIIEQGEPNSANCICQTNVSYTISGISQNEVNVIFINGVQVYCYNDINSFCEFENPLTDLPWLKNLIDVWKLNGWRSKVHQCTYKDGIGFLLEPCVGCPDAGYSFWNCEGVVLCGGGGHSGEDNCSEFIIDFESKILIYEY